jgi:hypothetical protein
VLERHDVVAVAVEDEQRDVQVADALQARVGVRHERRRDERVMHAGHRTDVGERRQEHESRGRVRARQLDRDAAAERLAQVEDARRVDPGLFPEARESGVRVAVGPVLVRSAAAPAVAAIVEQHHVEAHGGEQLGVQHAVADVARVAVAEQHVADRCRACVDPPGVQPFAVLRLELQVAVGQARVARRAEELARGEIEHRAEQGTH